MGDHSTYILSLYLKHLPLHPYLTLLSHLLTAFHQDLHQRHQQQHRHHQFQAHESHRRAKDFHRTQQFAHSHSGKFLLFSRSARILLTSATCCLYRRSPAMQNDHAASGQHAHHADRLLVMPLSVPSSTVISLQSIGSFLAQTSRSLRRFGQKASIATASLVCERQVLRLCDVMLARTESFPSAEIMATDAANICYGKTQHGRLVVKLCAWCQLVALREQRAALLGTLLDGKLLRHSLHLFVLAFIASFQFLVAFILFLVA